MTIRAHNGDHRAVLYKIRKI